MKPSGLSWWVVRLLGVREERNGIQKQIKKLILCRHPFYMGWRFFCLRLAFSPHKAWASEGLY